MAEKLDTSDQVILEAIAVKIKESKLKSEEFRKFTFAIFTDIFPDAKHPLSIFYQLIITWSVDLFYPNPHPDPLPCK